MLFPFARTGMVIVYWGDNFSDAAPIHPLSLVFFLPPFRFRLHYSFIRAVTSWNVIPLFNYTLPVFVYLQAIAHGYHWAISCENKYTRSHEEIRHNHRVARMSHRSEEMRGTVRRFECLPCYIQWENCRRCDRVVRSRARASLTIEREGTNKWKGNLRFVQISAWKQGGKRASAIQVKVAFCWNV